MGRWNEYQVILIKCLTIKFLTKKSVLLVVIGIGTFGLALAFSGNDIKSKNVAESLTSANSCLKFCETYEKHHHCIFLSI